MWFGWNIFRDLDDLPDKPRLGTRLMLIGAFFFVLRLTWPRVAPSSFQRVSETFLRHLDFFRTRYGPHSLEDFGVLLYIAATMCFLYGAFIFLRRGFWWVAEHRPEPETTELKLK